METWTNDILDAYETLELLGQEEKAGKLFALMRQFLFLMVNEIHFALKLFDTEMPVLYKVDLLWKPDASHDQVKTVEYSIFCPL